MSVLAAGHRISLALPAAFLLAIGLACNGNGVDPEDPSISISLTPTSASVQQGGSVEVAVSVTGSGGFSGVASIALANPPTGISGSVSGTQSSAGNTTGTLTIEVAESAAPGMYTLDVRASGSGVSAVVATFTLTVDAAPAYVLAVSPSQLTVEQGGEGTVGVSLARTNFNGAVTLALEGAPSGVAASFDVNPVTGSAAALTLTVDASVAAGSYTLTVRGTAAGLTDRTVTLSLTVAEPGTSSYSLSLDPASVAVAQGGSATIGVTITRVSFVDAVDLSLEGAPTGVTGTFDPDPAGGDASVLTLAVGATVSPDQYALTVRGTTAGLADRTAGLTLTVDPAPGFDIESIDPISIQQGQSGVRTVTIDRTGGFSGDVTVTVTDLPTGVTAVVDPTTTSGGSVQVTVTVAGTAAVGNYTATVRGNATGLPESTEELDISVLTASGQQVSLDFSICTPDQRPVWLAYQDGSGPWTPVNGVGDTYTFNVAGARAAVAVATDQGSSTEVFVLYATQAELVTGDLGEVCDVVATGKTVTGTVAGIDVGLGEGAAISLGSAVTTVQQDGPFSLGAVPDGMVNLVGYKWSDLGTTDRMFISRGLDPAPGSDIGTVDFAGAGAFDPIAATITVQGGTGDSGTWETEYATTPSPGVCHYAALDDFFYTGNQFLAGGAPVGEQQANEFHVVSVSDGLNYVSEMFAEWQNRTISFGAPIPTPTVTDVSGGAGYRRLTADVVLPAEYNSLTTFLLVDDVGSTGFALLATADWVGGTSVSLEVPDLSAAAGWNDQWAPPTTSTTDWLFSASGWTGTECVEGAREVNRVQVGSVN